MAELLDLTRYLPAEQQPQLWLLAMENLNNSEDAAAIAEFYQQNPQAQDVLKPEWRQLKRCINEACGAEIEGTDDPDHLNHVLADLYRIEDALDLDMKPLIQDIYFTLDDAGMELDDDGLAVEFAPVYYLRPDGVEEHGEVMRELGLIRGGESLPKFESNAEKIGQKVSTKVLVISNNVFSNQKNNGKTLLSFFKDVAKKNLQQIFFSGEAPDCDCARGYFRISDSDVVKSIIKPGKKAGSIINYETGIKATPSSNQKAKATTLLREYESIRLLREVAWALSPKNEVELERWVVDFSPDVVFFCAGDSGFAYDVYEKVCKFLPGSKKCIYITDDYILPRPTISLFWWIRRQIVLKKMKRSVTASDIFVTISEKMRSEYKRIFGVDSIVAFNMPESIRVEGFVKSEREDLVLVYAGGLHFNRWKTLKRLGEALDVFNRENDRQITLKIYSHQELSRKVQEALSSANSSEFGGSLDRDGVRCALNDADILVHVESFSKRNVYSTRLSVSTKISEYLVAGKPVLAIGPSELASMEFLSKRGFCITSNKDLKNKLKEFFLSDRSVGLSGKEQELEFLANEREFKRLVLTSSSLQSKRRNDQK